MFLPQITRIRMPGTTSALITTPKLWYCRVADLGIVITSSYGNRSAYYDNTVCPVIAGTFSDLP